MKTSPIGFVTSFVSTFALFMIASSTLNAQSGSRNAIPSVGSGTTQAIPSLNLGSGTTQTLPSNTYRQPQPVTNYSAPVQNSVGSNCPNCASGVSPFTSNNITPNYNAGNVYSSPTYSAPTYTPANNSTTYSQSYSVPAYRTTYRAPYSSYRAPLWNSRPYFYPRVNRGFSYGFRGSSCGGY